MAVMDDAFDEPRENALRRVLPWLVAALVLAAIAWFVWGAMNSVVGVKKDEPPPVQVQVDMLPPPPPPPPPPPEPQEKPPEPSPETPSPTPEPTPEKPTPAPMQIDGPAQAGADSFGLSSGTGGGMGAPGSTGTCVGTNCGGSGTSGGISDAFYRRYLASALQEKLDRDKKLSRLVFAAYFLVTITPDGRVSKVVLDQSSGDGERDQTLQAALEGVGRLDPPPASVKFPQRIKVTGKRSLS